MRILVISLMASLTAAAQTPQTKAPTYTTEPIMHQVPRCEAGWHLEQWHYGNDSGGILTGATSAVFIADPSGYRAVVEYPKADPHPDRCVKDAPKAK